MQAIKLSLPASLDNLKRVELADPGQPGAGQIRVRIHACSLNFHDYAVVTGALPTADGRIPMADGAGVVDCLLYTSPSPRDRQKSRMPSSA